MPRLLSTSIALLGLGVSSLAGCGGGDSTGDGSAAPAGTGSSVTTPPKPGTDGTTGSGHYAGGDGTVLEGGALSCPRYQALAADYSALTDYLSGPAYAAFHKDDGSDKPTVYSRNNGGTFCYGDCDKAPVDWAGFGGQILYGKGPGMSRARFNWARSEGHGGKQFAHLYLLFPTNHANDSDHDSWYTSLIDPAVDQPAWKKANGGKALAEPLAIGRGKIAWSNNGLVAFKSGLIGAVGSGNSSDNFPFIQLEAGKLPTDVAVTNNNEFGLVTLWDTKNCKGQLAVIALQQRDGYLFGVPNEGFLSGMKLLGYVDLPVAAPTRINASNDYALYMSYSSKAAVAELATQAGRDRWSRGEDVQHGAASAGFALIASREENKVVVLDLEPLFQSYRTMYLTTQANYDKTLKLGDAPGDWPYAFSASKGLSPVVVQTLDVPSPCAVVTGYPVGDRSFTDIDFAKKAYVASLDGTLTSYDVGGLAVKGPVTALKPGNAVKIGKNPTRVFYSAAAGKSRDGLVFACRGDRTIHFVDGGGKSQQILDDSRLKDPVDVLLGNARGAVTLTVADYDGHKVVNYLDGPIDAWGDDLFNGLGADGKSPFEFTGWLGVDGPAFAVSAAQVP